MNILDKYKLMVEAAGSTLYGEGNRFTARVMATKDGKYVAKFFRNGVHMQMGDYDHADPKEVHEFAQEEVARRKAEDDSVNERIDLPQGHLESADHITDDSNRGKGPTKKMMGNRTPLEIVAKILAGR